MTSPDQIAYNQQELTICMLHELCFAVHRFGYKQLCVAIPQYALDSSQSVTKNLYPYVAEYFDTDWHAVEHSIRFAVQCAWKQRDPEVWNKYFPNSKKAPSNKEFIATLAERLR